MDKVAEFNWNISKEDTKRHINADFLVEKPYTRLIFDCSYTPKYLTDETIGLGMMRKEIVDAGYSNADYSDEELLKCMPLANHISWSIDSPLGLVGTKHIHNPNQVLVVSNGGSTPGLKQTPIYEGRWAITASLNAILTNSVSIHIVVSGELDD